MKNKIYLLIALCLPVFIRCMEGSAQASLDALPIELKLTIAKHIRGTSCLKTITLIKQLGLISHAWDEISRDNKLIKDVIERYKEKYLTHYDLYYQIKAAATETLTDSELHSLLMDDRYEMKLIKQRKYFSFYGEFVRAAALGKLPLVKLLLENDPDLCSNGNIDTQAALNQAFVSAAKHNHPEIVRYLLDNGGNVNAQDLQNRSPLTRVIKNKYFEVFKILQEAGLAIDQAL